MIWTTTNNDMNPPKGCWVIVNCIANWGVGLKLPGLWYWSQKIGYEPVHIWTFAWWLLIWTVKMWGLNPKDVHVHTILDINEHKNVDSTSPLKMGRTCGWLNWRGCILDACCLSLSRPISTLTHYSDIVSHISSGSLWYVYVHVCMYVCMYVCIYIYIYLCKYIYILPLFPACIVWHSIWHSLRHSLCWGPGKNPRLEVEHRSTPHFCWIMTCPLTGSAKEIAGRLPAAGCLKETMMGKKWHIIDIFFMMVSYYGSWSLKCLI